MLGIDLNISRLRARFLSMDIKMANAYRFNLISKVIECQWQIFNFLSQYRHRFL